MYLSSLSDRSFVLWMLRYTKLPRTGLYIILSKLYYQSMYVILHDLQRFAMESQELMTLVIPHKVAYTLLYWTSQLRGEETWDGGVNWLILSHNLWCLSITNNGKANPYGKWRLETEIPSPGGFKPLNRLSKKSYHSDFYFSSLASFSTVGITDVKSWCLKRCDV